MLRIENLSKVYNPGLVNEMALFDNFSLEIGTGEFVTVVGSNGSGKTSLLNLICGNLRQDGGKIYLNKDDISDLPEYKRSMRIGRVFQDPSKGACPSMTILENMAMADNKAKSFNLRFGVNKKKIEAYKNILRQLKLGLEDKMNTKVGDLSGGQRQALALLLSTMTPLDLLILDEHTAALDPKSCENIMELTDEIVKRTGVTTLMVTHNLKYAIQYGNRILMLHRGEVILDEGAESKMNVDVDRLLKIFTDISVELGN